MHSGPVAAEPSLQAIKELNKVGDIKVCTFDTSPEILNALVNNRLEFAVDQQQWLQGYLPVFFLANYVKYGSMVQNDLNGGFAVFLGNQGKGFRHPRRSERHRAAIVLRLRQMHEEGSRPEEIGEEEGSLEITARSVLGCL